MAIGLTADGKALVFVLMRAKGCRLRVAELPDRLNWIPERTVDALAALQGSDWVTIRGNPVEARLTPWARAKTEPRPRPQIHTVSIDPDSFPDRRYPDGEPHVVTNTASPWRETHAPDCGCAECGQSVSATHPTPETPCVVCDGLGPGPGWTCLGCHRRNYETVSPTLPRQKPTGTPRSGIPERGTIEISPPARRSRRCRKDG